MLVKSPILTQIRKSVKHGTFQTRKFGRIVFQKLRKPRNPNTPAQQDTRQKYGKAVEFWRKLSPDQKAEWNAQARRYNLSGFNLFLKRFFEAKTEEIPCLDSCYVYRPEPDEPHPCYACGESWESSQCYLDQDDGNKANVYVLFDFLSRIPALAYILEAKLSISLAYEECEIGTPKPLKIFYPASSWSSDTLTWNNRPARAKLLASRLLDKCYSSMELDLTDHYNEIVQGMEDNGLEITLDYSHDNFIYGFIYNAKLTVTYLIP